MPSVVVIGGSFAGLNALSTIFKTKTTSDLQVTLIAPSSHAYFNVASPRLLSEPGKFKDTVFPLAEAVATISNGRGTFLHGSATSVDFESREITVERAKGGESRVKYDILVLASGTESKWAGYKVNTDHQEAESAILAANTALKSASAVAIVGGGPTGTESAGEIAHDFPNASVTLYTGGSGPLAGAAATLSQKAVSKLEALRVEIVNNVQVKTVTHSESGKSSLELGSGETKEYDVILESYITKPYSEYLPKIVKDEKGYVVTNADLLVRGQRGVIALGDIVAGGSKSVVDIKLRQAGIFQKTFQKLLSDISSPSFYTEAGNSEEKESTYEPVTHTIMVPISREGGVGMLFGWSIPNFLIVFGKAKTFMIEKGRGNFY